jgi:Uma2 family endonuclease
MNQIIRPKRTTPVPVPKKWTVAEFHKVFSQPDLRAQRPYLIGGVIWEQGEMNPPHAYVLTQAHAALQKVVPPGTLIRNQLALVFDLHTDPEPDLAVVRGEASDFRKIHPNTAALVIEVSDTTLYEDRTTKAELYATAGIADYWILDVNSEKLIVHRQPDANGTYGEVQTYGKEASISPLALPGVVLRVAEFF